MACKQSIIGRGRYYTTSHVAQLLNCGVKTVVMWCDKGLLRYHRLPHTPLRRIQHEDLIRFLKVHGMPLPEVLDFGKQGFLVTTTTRSHDDGHQEDA